MFIKYVNATMQSPITDIIANVHLNVISDAICPIKGGPSRNPRNPIEVTIAMA